MVLRRTLGCGALVLLTLTACGGSDGVETRGADASVPASSTDETVEPATAPVELSSQWGTIEIEPLPGLQPVVDVEPSGPEEAQGGAADSSVPLSAGYEAVSQSYTAAASGGGPANFDVRLNVAMGPGTTADLAADERMVPAGDQEGHLLYTRTETTDPAGLPDGQAPDEGSAWTSIAYEFTPGGLLWVNVTGTDVELARSYLDDIQITG